MSRRRSSDLAASVQTPVEPPPPPQAMPRDSVRTPWMKLGVAAAGAVLLLGGMLLAAQPMAKPATPVAATMTACPSIAAWLEVIASYERSARWSLTASTAQTALRTPGLCADDRAALAAKLLVASREALFEEPPAPEDMVGQRRVAAAYVDLKNLSRQYAQPEPPPLQIARGAYDQRLFLLATAAFADAFTSGTSTVEDRDVVRADYAAQRNLGLIWAQRTDTAQRQEGLARLATACRIQERQRLSSPEACDDLRRLVGTPDRWPTPIADPLLDAPASPPSARGG